MDRFRADDNECRQYAYMQVGGKTTQQSANESAVASAVVGTAIGGSQGAAVGAGTGLLIGGAAGTNTAMASGYGTQRQYDNAYIQCMYAKGHRVPVPANKAYPRTINNPNTAFPPPSGTQPPPPPPGMLLAQPPGTR